ncbi:hypothetical protein EMPS_03131 [Entomortierella parvispora]|uniref:Uncharacterized protein n=1 Tax=Entomortierella parvispora TaxID=205924 RepID=A0A9P3LU46_9FUNG|nr:hypothetical protein EMPS_03131 [Entomortierella parvispora]
MKAAWPTMHAAVLLPLLLAPWQAASLQFPFQRVNPTHPAAHQASADSPPASETLTPYTMPWVNELQALYNTFGEIRNDSSCPTELEDWACAPYPMSELDFIPPDDVWRLRPHDIKSVIAIGDSITAGFAMVSGRPPFATVLEFRGKVFSGGGDDGEYTLANFLGTYANDIKGSPSGVTLPLAHGKGLNMAVSGSVAQTLGPQIERLRRQFSWVGTYRRYKKKWKMITVFIGANNLCQACESGDDIPEHADPEEYGKALKLALQDLKASVGPAFVNLVGIFDVTLVYERSRGYPYCEMLFDKMPIPICSCATSGENNRKKAGDLAKKYNEVMERIAQEINEEKEGSKTFGVVFQPGLTEFKNGSSPYGQGYMSGLDCFHPNKCANQIMAISLWNNMFASRENKNKPMRPHEIKIFCPGPNDYLQ